MRTTNLPGTDLDISVIVLGTAWYGTEIAEQMAFDLMDGYAEQGGNLLDTANMYYKWREDGEGKSESTIGTWLKSARPEGMMIATKGADEGMNRATIREQLNESLDRLGVESVALYWLHCDDPDVPVSDILGWMNECADEGLFNAFGCSNWRLPRIREAAQYSAETGCRGFSANQISWSLARAIHDQIAKLPMVFMDDEMSQYHQQNRWPCFGFSSQAGGFFAGKYDPVSPTAGTTPNENIVRIFGSESNYARLAAAKEIAEERGVSSNQVALAYLASQSFPGYAVAGPNCMPQLLDSCGGGKIILSPEECKRLETV